MGSPRIFKQVDAQCKLRGRVWHLLSKRVQPLPGGSCWVALAEQACAAFALQLLHVTLAAGRAGGDAQDRDRDRDSPISTCSTTTAEERREDRRRRGAS